jgi:hypothetical protein
MALPTSLNFDVTWYIATIGTSDSGVAENLNGLLHDVDDDVVSNLRAPRFRLLLKDRDMDGSNLARGWGD